MGPQMERLEAWALVLAGGLPMWSLRGPVWAPQPWWLGAKVGVLKEPAGSCGTFCDRPHRLCIVRRAAVTGPPRLEVQACRPRSSLSSVSLPAAEECVG